MKKGFAAMAVAVLVVGSLAAGYGIGNATRRTGTVTSTTLEISPATTTVTNTVTQTLTVPTYTLTFQQVGECNPPVYELPYGITLYVQGSNQSRTAPLGTTLPTTRAGWDNVTVHSASSASQTDINFTVPSGIYNYIELDPFLSNGTANVNGTNTIVHLQLYLPVPCFGGG